jgi:IclR family transcriptional regulator, KDG regulon repressor
MKAIENQTIILDALSSAPAAGTSVTDLRLLTNLPVSTLHRTLDALRRYEIVVQDDTKRWRQRWRLGPRVVLWAGKYLKGPASFEPLRGSVRKLSQETQFFSYLTILDHGELVCVAVERPEHKAQCFVQLGSRLPVLSTAAAKALLAFEPEDEARPLVERAIAENPRTHFETVTAGSYFEELREVRRRGYATCAEELEVGVSALGAPVLNARRRPVASLTVVAPTAALAEEWDSTVEKLLDIAGEASVMAGAESSERMRGYVR